MNNSDNTNNLFCGVLRAIDGREYEVVISKQDRRNCLVFMNGNEQRKLRYEQLECERNISDNLLNSIFPENITKIMKENRRFQNHNNNNKNMGNIFLRSKLITIIHGEFTCIFSDLIVFTKFASNTSAEVVVQFLNDRIGSMDDTSKKYSVEKIKTIGDCWFGCCGVPKFVKDHPILTFRFAMDMLRNTIRQINETHHTSLQIRTGIHTGKAVSGVIAVDRYQYDVFGATVNTASRMMSSGAPSCIHVSKETFKHVEKLPYTFRKRIVDVKGMGRMVTYIYESEYIKVENTVSTLKNNRKREKGFSVPNRLFRRRKRRNSVSRFASFAPDEEESSLRLKRE